MISQYYLFRPSKKTRGRCRFFICDATAPSGERTIAKFAEEKHAQQFMRTLQAEELEQFKKEIEEANEAKRTKKRDQPAQGGQQHADCRA